MIFVGVDWAEDHHDPNVRDVDGAQLATRRVPHGVDGLARLHELVGGFVVDPDEVVIGIETDHGLLVSSWPAPATGCSRSTRVRSTGIGIGTRCRARSRTRPMRWCWPNSSAPTAITTDRLSVTATMWRA